MFSRSFSFTAAASSLLVLVALGLLSGPAGFGPGEQSAEATFLSEVKKLLASDSQPGDFFGRGVAVSGDTAIVGACCEDDGGDNAGAAYVFVRNEGGADNWGEVTKLTASDAQAGDIFGYSVAVSGDTAIIGARGEAAGGSDAGAAYVFVRDEGGADSWGEVTKLTASDAEADDQFGRSVALSRDTAVVGAPYEAGGDDDVGAAYVFERDRGGADNWGESKKLTASDAGADDHFGISTAVSGDIAVVGASGEGVLAGSEGAYVFGRDEGGADNWGEVTKLIASGAEENHGFGIRVAISGDTAAVGATGDDARGNGAGAAYVFGRDQGGVDNWGELKKLTASDGQQFDRLGSSVAVSVDTVVVGARGADSGDSAVVGARAADSGDSAVVGAHGDAAGAAYVFRRDQGGADNWGESNKLTASDARAGALFGRSVAVSGDTAVVGAHFHDPSRLGTGAAYVFDLLLSKPMATPTATACPTGKVPADSGCGTLTPTPTETPSPTPPFSGVMEVDCDAGTAGIQSDCTHSTGDAFSMQVHVTAPPEGGYFFIEVKLSWTDEILDYLPAASPREEALWPECDIPARLDVLPFDSWLFFACVPFPWLSQGDTFTGPVLHFQFQCRQDGTTPLDLVPRPGDPQGGTVFSDDDLQAILPSLANATVTCAEPTPTPTPIGGSSHTTVAGLSFTPTPIGGSSHDSHTTVAAVSLPQTGAGSAGSSDAAVLTWLAAGAVAGALVLCGAAWYARGRWVR